MRKPNLRYSFCNRKKDKNFEVTSMLLGVLIGTFLAFNVTLVGNASYDLMTKPHTAEIYLVFSFFLLLTLMFVRLLVFVIDGLTGDQDLKMIDRKFFILRLIWQSWKTSKLWLLGDFLLFVAVVYYGIHVFGVSSWLRVIGLG